MIKLFAIVDKNTLKIRGYFHTEAEANQYLVKNNIDGYVTPSLMTDERYKTYFVNPTC